MMQEPCNDKIFTDLLKEYATPLKDAGFSDRVLASVRKQDKAMPQKSLFVGSAAILGGGYAALQLPNLWRYLSTINLTSPQLPKFDYGQLEAVVSGSTYMMIGSALFAVFVFWVCSIFLLADSL